MPQLQSDDDRSRTAAITVLSALGDPQLAAKLAELYSDLGGDEALERMTRSPDVDVATAAKEAIQRIDDWATPRIIILMSKFHGRVVPGTMFGIDDDVYLPEFSQVKPVRRGVSEDLIGTSHDSDWLVDIRVTLPPLQSLHRLIERIKDNRRRSPKSKYWLIIMDDITSEHAQILRNADIMYSTRSQIEALERVVSG